jgi:hypothetical protein
MMERRNTRILCPHCGIVFLVIADDEGVEVIPLQED